LIYRLTSLLADRVIARRAKVNMDLPAATRRRSRMRIQQ
jgi:hypothetical protein